MVNLFYNQSKQKVLLCNWTLNLFLWTPFKPFILVIKLHVHFLLQLLFYVSNVGSTLCLIISKDTTLLLYF